MRRLVFAGVSLVAVLLNGSPGLACGDKLLVVGRGVRFARAYSQHQANIVIYAKANQGPAILTSTKLQATLKQAGHTVQVVEDASQLDGALKSGKVDLVLAGIADIAGISRQLQSANSKPIVLPILVKPSKAEFGAAQKEYKFALKASADEIQFLTAIDEAMKSRPRIVAKV